MLCKQGLGFGTPVYCYPGRTGHADGIEDAHRRALLKFVEDLADLAAKLYLERKLPPSEGAPRSRKKRPSARKSRGKAAAPGVPESESGRYLLPEFDMHFSIPSGRGKKKPSMKLEQHHHLLWPGKPDEVGELGSKVPGER